MEPAGRIELPHFPYEGKGLPLTYAGIWWALWDSNPGSTGYEPGAVTNSAKGPDKTFSASGSPDIVSGRG